jgi:hypothetical protein
MYRLNGKNEKCILKFGRETSRNLITLKVRLDEGILRWLRGSELVLGDPRYGPMMNVGASSVEP